MAKQLLPKGVGLGKFAQLLKLTDISRVIYYANLIPLSREDVYNWKSFGEVGRIYIWYSKILVGEVAEWSNAAVLKTVASQGAVSSNLTLSARFKFFWEEITREPIVKDLRLFISPIDHFRLFTNDHQFWLRFARPVARL